jgi:hypothetical protein
MGDASGIAEGLRALVAKGFKFAHPRDASGSVVAVTGVRPHRDVVDVVQIYGEHDADAVRMPADEVDILFPRRVLWRVSGRADEVINSMLALPDPIIERPAEQKTEQVGAVAPRGGCWVPTVPGRSTWLAAAL